MGQTQKRTIAAIGLLLLLAAIAMRFYALGTYPGMNGDEAQMGEEVLKFLHHEPYTIRTTSGLYFNPIFLAMESVLLKIFPANFTMVRLPATICSVLALFVVYKLHKRAFGNRLESLLAAVTLACLPLALCYSRCAWDATFMLLTAPLVLYPMLMIALGKARKFDGALLLLGVFLCLWVHVTSGLMLLNCGIGIILVRSDAIARKLRMESSVLAAGATLLSLLVIATTLFFLLCWLTYRPAIETLHSIFESAIFLVTRPRLALGYLSLVGDFLSGARGYMWYAGQIPTRALALTTLAMIILTIVLTIRALLSKNAGDRFIGLMWTILPVLLIAAVGRTGLQILGSERYVIWILPMFAILIARTMNRWLILAMCVTFLVQVPIYYFQPLITGSTQATLDPRFWTADPPKEYQAAEIIKGLDTFPSGRRVFADRWWVEHPLRFVLFHRNEVVPPAEPLTRQDIRRGFFIVGFSGQEFIMNSMAQLNAAHRSFVRRDVPGPSGAPVLTVIFVPPPDAS